MEKDKTLEVKAIMIERKMVEAFLDRLEAVQLFLQYAASACPGADEFPDLPSLLGPMHGFFTGIRDSGNWEFCTSEELKASGITRYEIGPSDGTSTPAGRA